MKKTKLDMSTYLKEMQRTLTTKWNKSNHDDVDKFIGDAINNVYEACRLLVNTDDSKNIVDRIRQIAVESCFLDMFIYVSTGNARKGRTSK